MLTREAYSLIARVLAEMPSFAPNLRAQRRSCYNSFVERLKQDNPRFDEFKFRLAANMGEHGELLATNKADEG